MKTAALFLFLSSLGAGTAVAGACLPGPPPSRGDGSIAGVTVPGGTQYYFKDALLAGFDCFEELSSWFPSYITTTNALSPTRVVVDMAYAAEATATFFNVVVPARGNYTLTFRYAFASGLFPGVTNRPEGIKVNDVVITSSLSFPITGSFTTYQNSSLLVPLNAGKNTIQMFNIASASVSRLDAMTVTAADAGSCIAVPGAPGALSAQAAGSTSQVSLTWTGSAAPAGCTAVSYSVFRSTTPGFTPSGTNQIASALAAATYTDSTALCGTTYYYLVEAVDSAGASIASNQAAATTIACAPSGVVEINAGGAAVSPFSADIDFAGGSTIHHANTIDLSKVANPAPMAVYQTARVGSFTYNIPGFNAGSLHTVRLHFAETYFGTIGSRTFNVSINGTTALTNFDISAASAGKNIAVVKEFTLPASSTGNYVITFTSVINQSLVSGIEIQ